MFQSSGKWWRGNPALIAVARQRLLQQKYQGWRQCCLPAQPCMTKSSAALWCFGEPGISPMLPPSLWSPLICIWEVNITWDNYVDSEKTWCPLVIFSVMSRFVEPTLRESGFNLFSSNINCPVYSCVFLFICPLVCPYMHLLPAQVHIWKHRVVNSLVSVPCLLGSSSLYGFKCEETVALV